MTVKIGTPFRRKKWLIILTVLAGILIMFMLFVNTLLAPVISRKIKNAVIKSSDSLYRLSFSSLKLNIFTGNAELSNVKLIPDTARRQAPAQLYSGSAKQLLITGAHPFKYWFGKKLDVGQITLTGPNVSLSLLRAPHAPPKNQKTLYQKLANSLKYIHVNSIHLDHVQFAYFNRTAPVPSAYHLKELNFVATDLLIDSATQKDTSRTLFCRDISVGIRNFSGISADGNYHFKLRSAAFSTRNQRLIARGIVLQPLPVSQFFARTKADRFGFDLDSMVLDQFNYGTFMLDHYLEANKLSAFKGSLGIYSNPNGLLPKTDRIITFPHYIIRTLKTHFAVDTLDIAGFNVAYTEFNKQSSRAGTLTFKNTRARFLHISNQKLNLEENPLCTAGISTFFMGSGKLDLSCVFNLTDKIYAYQYSGHLAAMSLIDINTLVMPLALGKVKSGELRSLDFTINGNRKTNTGTLKLLYNDLDIDLLDRNYHSKPIKTLLANTLVVKHDNPDQGSANPRFAKVVFIRPKNYPFFRTLWATLLSGIKPCAGMGYAVTPAPAKPLSKEEQKARGKALKKALKEKKKADKNYQKQLKKQAEKQN